MKPRARILVNISVVNTTMNTISISSCKRSLFTSVWKKFGSSYQLDRHDRLVVVWKLVVEGHDDTVRHDGYDDDPLEGRPIDLELFFLPRDYFQCWNFAKIWCLTCCQNVNDNFKGLIDVSSASSSCWQWQSYFANRPTNKHQFTFPIILWQTPKTRFCQINLDVTWLTMTLITKRTDNNINIPWAALSWKQHDVQQQQQQQQQ